MSKMLWDMAGIDGLAVAQKLFGKTVGALAPFQSLETRLQGEDCSVLRLCDRNFRIAYPGPLDQQVEAFHGNLWVKQFDWLEVISLSVEQLPIVSLLATVRAPHRLKRLPNHQAVPAQLEGIAILVWQHPSQGKPSLELHVSRHQMKHVTKRIKSFTEGGSKYPQGRNR